MVRRDTIATKDQECDFLWLVSSLNIDYAFMYDSDNNHAKLIKLSVDNGRYIENIDGFREFLTELVHPDDLSVVEKAFESVEYRLKRIDFEVRIKERKGRRYRWHGIHMLISEEEGGTVYVGSSTYVDNRKNRENELSLKARQDPLTGLLNKEVTREVITNYLKHQTGNDCAMIVLDIDSFKHYNDCVGHLFGDELIKEVAARLKQVFGDNSFIGRVGGDEFLVFIKNVEDVNNVIAKMVKLQSSLKDVTMSRNLRLNITCSAGISLYPDMGDDYDSLFAPADMALYYVKSHGKNSFAIFTEELYSEVSPESNKKEVKDDFDKGEEENFSIIRYAFKLLKDTSDVPSAINLLLYKIQNEYNAEAIYVHELNGSQTSVECIYERTKENAPSLIGNVHDFSREAWKEITDKNSLCGGYSIYDLSADDAALPMSYKNGTYNFKSMIQVDMKSLSRNMGCIDILVSRDASFWNERKVLEILAVCNLITMCMNYSKRVSQAEGTVKRFSAYDSLTGLMKEDTFISKAGEIIPVASAVSKLAVLYLDISNFKYINEMYGYVVGDRMLAQMGEYIAHKVNGVICAGRFYSDNILCLMEFYKDMTDERITQIVDDINVALSQYLSRVFAISNIHIRTGIYILPDKDIDPSLAVSNANLARKIAKDGHGARCVVFNQEMYDKKKRQIGYIQELDRAIANEEFYVCLQPKVSGSEHKLVGAEALVRWRKPDGTIIFPDEYIPAFEKEGSIVKLDFFVYEKVFEFIKMRIAQGKKVVPISMNVSRAHLATTDFLDKFEDLMRRYDIPVEYIELELTESIYLENFSEANNIVEYLRNKGIKISMDDFGSGYSSLNALNDLNIDLLKIDKIFMKDKIPADGDKAVVKFIIELAKSLKMQVLCEGVESNEQIEFLNAVGCVLHQGYYYSKPVELSRFVEFLDNETLLFEKEKED